MRKLDHYPNFRYALDGSRSSGVCTYESRTKLSSCNTTHCGTSSKIDAFVHTGDLAQVPVPRTYQRYLDFMQSLKTPFYQVPGNHDNAEHFPFHQQQNKVHVIHFGPWSVVLLNSAVKGKIDGWVDETQLNQLEQILQEFAQQHILIACHHHPFEMQSKWIDQHKLKNTQDLTAVLAKYHNVKIVLSGHVHQESWREWHSIQFYSTPSTSVQFKPLSDHFALDEQSTRLSYFTIKRRWQP